jgi:hypothetical protein
MKASNRFRKDSEYLSGEVGKEDICKVHVR